MQNKFAVSSVFTNTKVLIDCIKEPNGKIACSVTIIQITT